MVKLKAYRIGKNGELISNKFGGFYLRPDVDKVFKQYSDILIELKKEIIQMIDNQKE